MLEREQQMTVLDRLYGVIVNPGPTLQAVARDRLYGWGLAIVLASALVSQLITQSGEPLPPGFESMGPVSTIAFGLVIFVIYTVIFHVVAKMFGGTGTLLGYVAAVGFATFPTFFRLPLILLQSTPLGLIAGPLLVLVALWLLVLNVLAVKHAYDLTVGKSIGAIIVGIIVVVIVLAALFIGYMLANPELAAQWAALAESM